MLWFGIISAVGSLLGIATTELVNRRLNMNHAPSLLHALTIINLLLILGMVSFALAGNFYLALLSVWGVGIMRTASRPLYNTWITQNSDSRVRATIFSAAGMIDAMGQIGGGPAIGYIGERVSIRAALTATSLLLSPILFFFLRGFRLLQRSDGASLENQTLEAATEIEG